MEQKLAKFRESRRSLNQPSLPSRLLQSVGLLNSEDPAANSPSRGVDNRQEHDLNHSAVSTADIDQSDSFPADINQSSFMSRLYTLFKLVLWSSALYYLGCCGLAGPFILISIVAALIYYGTSSGKTRKKTELSAYSVFNPNCVRLEGTFTAEQFENELLRRPLDSTRSS